LNLYKIVKIGTCHILQQLDENVELFNKLDEIVELKLDIE